MDSEFPLENSVPVSWHLMIHCASVWAGNLEPLCPLPAHGCRLLEQSKSKHHLFSAAASPVPLKCPQSMAFPACVMLPAKGMWFFSLLWDQAPAAFQLSGNYPKASAHFCLGSLPALVPCRASFPAYFSLKPSLDLLIIICTQPASCL